MSGTLRAVRTDLPASSLFLRGRGLPLPLFLLARASGLPPLAARPFLV